MVKIKKEKEGIVKRYTPLALIMFVLVFFFNNEKVVIIGILTWIGIPSAYSFIFYYKKIKGINV